jgi:hypothetical protein
MPFVAPCHTIVFNGIWERAVPVARSGLNHRKSAIAKDRLPHPSTLANAIPVFTMVSFGTILGAVAVMIPSPANREKLPN